MPGVDPGYSEGGGGGGGGGGGLTVMCGTWLWQQEGAIESFIQINEASILVKMCYAPH